MWKSPPFALRAGALLKFLSKNTSDVSWCRHPELEQNPAELRLVPTCSPPIASCGAKLLDAFESSPPSGTFSFRRLREFGAKLSVSVVDGFSFVDRLSWDNYNESQDLIGQIERYKDRFGFYPESVHVDKIYRTRENRAYCRERGIRMSGPPLGRKPQTVSREEKRQAAADEAIRNQVEGKFGQAKRRFGLGRVMAKLATTSAAQIVLTFLMMNLERALARLLFALAWLHGCWLTHVPGQHRLYYRTRHRSP
jgi:hypothetical protein